MSMISMLMIMILEALSSPIRLMIQLMKWRMTIKVVFPPPIYPCAYVAANKLFITPSVMTQRGEE